MIAQSTTRGENPYLRALDSEARRVLAELKGQDLVFMLLEIAQLMESHRDSISIAQGILSMLSERINLRHPMLLVSHPESGQPELRCGKGAELWPSPSIVASQGS